MKQHVLMLGQQIAGVINRCIAVVGFDLEEHVKNHSNATILEAKRRHELLTEQEKPPTRHRSIEVESVVNRLNKTDRSFFVKPETKADPINKQTYSESYAASIRSICC